MAGDGELENAQGKLYSPGGVLADRVADQLQEVGFDMAGGAAVNGGDRGRDSAQPGK